MTVPVADDFAFIKAREAELRTERDAARKFWCGCGHPGRTMFKTPDGFPICSACAKPVDE